MNLQYLLLESFGIKWNLNCAAWYVYFYIFMMVSLPVITNFMDKQLIRNSVAVIAFCVLWASLLGESDHLAAKSLQRCFFYLPVMVCGYVAAKQEWIRRVSNRGLVFSIFLGLCVMAARCATGGIKGFSTDILLVPLFIYSILSLFASMHLPIVEKVLASLGKASLYMWFLHAVFYSVGTRYAFASYVLWPDHLLISFLLVTLFSYLAARMCMWVDEKIVKLSINRL